MRQRAARLAQEGLAGHREPHVVARAIEQRHADSASSRCTATLKGG